jgi:hypothetical protein
LSEKKYLLAVMWIPGDSDLIAYVDLEPEYGNHSGSEKKWNDVSSLKVDGKEK